MGSPYQYPWVKFGSVMTAGIDSSETLLYTAPAATIIDSIIATNTTDQDIFIDLRTLRVDGDEPHVAYRRLVEKNNSIELLPSTQSILTLEPGDFVYAKSDFSNNLFDCIMSYRQLLEDPISLLSKKNVN
ncbi:MAG: hypothetical protein ACTHJ2_09570 [Candidatus Nitrosocosmicus sp.]